MIFEKVKEQVNKWNYLAFFNYAENSKNSKFSVNYEIAKISISNTWLKNNENRFCLY